MWTSSIRPINQFDFQAANSLYVATIPSTQQPVQPQPTTPDSSYLMLRETAIASASFLMLLGGLLLVRRSIHHWKTLSSSLHSPSTTSEDGLIWPVRKTQSPCLKCYYFKTNYYLPCAVNPQVALTPKAVDCSEFRPQEDNGQEGIS